MADEAKEPFERGNWPCTWLGCPGTETPPFVAAYRLKVAIEKGRTVRVHVTADERYELYLDGRQVGRGPERGEILLWFYETYDLELSAGTHVLVARVWSLGDLAPMAQMSVRPGFLLVAEEEARLFSTGVAPWEARKVEGYEVLPPLSEAWWVGGQVRIDGTVYPWGIERGEGEGWAEAVRLGTARDRINGAGQVGTPRLQPATLPAMLDRRIQVGRVRHVDDPGDGPTDESLVEASRALPEADRWQAMFTGGGEVTVEAGARRRVIVDLEDYYCAYADVHVSGGKGSTVRLLWAESLFEEKGGRGRRKGNRDQVEGKYFMGKGNAFLPDGGPGRVFSGLWWGCGRYLELDVETGAEPLTIHGVVLRETRYPLEMEGRFRCDDGRFDEVFPILLRGLQMCSHETYMDCPYYEQLMYAGDTRLEMLTTYVTTRDDRLPRKTLRLFDASRHFLGLSQARYPSRLPQYIPQFSLYWVAMVYDYALWRGDREFLRSLMPGVRSVMETFLAHMGADGLLVLPEGWDWIDWVPEWHNGRPWLKGQRVCGINHWQLIYVLGLAAQLERWMGEEALAERLTDRRQELARAGIVTFWDEGRGLVANAPDRRSFSEHAQCFAILGGALGKEKEARVAQGLEAAEDLDRATIYFRHYLFEAFRLRRRVEAIFERLGLWFELKANGFRTTLESPEPSRSDCHGWGAHPIYHAFASILGVRPASFGFETVEVAPQMGPLREVCSEIVHPKGTIIVDLQWKDHRLEGSVELPAGLTGSLVGPETRVPLKPGRNAVHLPA
ncbi:MAG: alpha-L-rhamnosidase C-terminal domain-containing protein [Phycisphaerae bacterium]